MVGTRHVVTVISEGKTKVAQYGQWDGYPTYTGAEIQKFLRTVNLEAFADSLMDVSWYTSDEMADAWTAAGSDGSGWVSLDVADALKTKHPELSRDTGVDVLWLIASGKVRKLQDESEFTTDTLWCEYHYVINLDEYTVTVYSSGNEIYKSSINDFINEDMEALQEL